MGKTQGEMADLLALGLRQYQSYEWGKYDEPEENQLANLNYYINVAKGLLSEHEAAIAGKYSLRSGLEFLQKEQGLGERVKSLEKKVQELQESLLDLYRRLPIQE